MAYAYKGMNYLRNVLNAKKTRVDLRYKYYEMKNAARDLDISTPPKLRGWNSALGWCGKAVDSLADRLVFREFRNDNFDMQGIFDMNNADILFDSADLSALISSCSFIYISADENGFPRLQVIDGANATGVIDPITYLLYEGYAVLSRDDKGMVKTEAYFTDKWTYIYESGKLVMQVANPTGHPLLVPIINRPDAKRLFGRSRISRACMDHTAGALRTIKRSEISAEFYSFPQKYATGLSPDKEFDSWRATMSSMIAFDKDDDGDHPVLGQFQQASMSPHLDHLKMFAGLFSAETGLTLEDMGFPSDNPTSAEAIKASHERLRLTARKAQRDFGTGFINVGYLAACLRDNFAYARNQIYQTKCVWEPIFEPDAATLSGIGDGAIKLNQAVPGYFDAQTLYDLTGIRPGGTE